MGPVIRKQSGFIDKYVGDGIMALFPGGSSEGALEAAVDIQKQLESFNSRLVSEGTEPVRVGIGIHSGKVILGTIGEKNRIEGTVISDVVNVASRLESLTKKYGVPVICSESVLNNLKSAGNYRHRSLGKTKVKGREQFVAIHEIFPPGDPKETTVSLFEKGIEHFHSSSYEAAGKFFRKVFQSNNNDNAAEFYL